MTARQWTPQELNDPLVQAIIQQESGGNPNALSPAGAAGIMQIMPATARDPGYGVTPLQGWDGVDPRTAPVAEQIRFGREYLMAMNDKFGSQEHALAAYNAGPGNVDKYGGVPPFQETQNYVKQVSANLQQGSPPSSQNSGWRSRATAVQPRTAQPAAQSTGGGSSTSDWRSRATPVKQQSQGFFGRQAGIAKNFKDQLQESADAYVAGKQTMPETVFQNAMSGAALFPATVGNAIVSTPGVGPVLEKIGGAVMSLPSAGGGTLGENLPSELDMLHEKYPRAYRNARGVVQAADTAATATGVTKAIDAVPKVAKAVGKVANKQAVTNYIKNLPADTPLPKKYTAEDLKTLSQEYFNDDVISATRYTPQEVSKPFATSLEKLRPRPIGGRVLTGEDKVLAKALDEFKGLDSTPLSMEDVINLDQKISTKINESFINQTTGLPTDAGRKLMILQDDLRSALDKIPDNAANVARKNANELWKAQLAVKDLDEIALRAELSQNYTTALRSGASNLLKNHGKRIKGWSPEAKEILRKIAEPSTGEELLRPLFSRLPGIIGLGSGNPLLGATANVAGVGARGIRDRLAAGQLGNLQQKIATDAINKVKPIPKNPKDMGTLLLAPPDKMSRLPMTDRQINISRKLIQGGKRNPVDPSGGAVKPPVSQRLKVSEGSTWIKGQQFKGMQTKLLSGEISQNKFVDQAMKSFNLTTTQARDLAKEIKTYGAVE